MTDTMRLKVLSFAIVLSILFFFRFHIERRKDQTTHEDLQKKLQEFVISEMGRNIFYMFTLPFVAILFSHSPRLFALFQSRGEWNLMLGFSLFHVAMKTTFMILGYHYVSDMMGLQTKSTDFQLTTLATLYWMKNATTFISQSVNHVHSDRKADAILVLFQSFVLLWSFLQWLFYEVPMNVILVSEWPLCLVVVTWFQNRMDFAHVELNMNTPADICTVIGATVLVIFTFLPSNVFIGLFDIPFDDPLKVFFVKCSILNSIVARALHLCNYETNEIEHNVNLLVVICLFFMDMRVWGATLLVLDTIFTFQHNANDETTKKNAN